MSKKTKETKEMKSKVLTARELLEQTKEEKERIQQQRDLEDAKTALTRAIEDKKSELKNLHLAEDECVKQFVSSSNSSNPNIFVSHFNKIMNTMEQIEYLEKILDTRFSDVEK